MVVQRQEDFSEFRVTWYAQEVSDPELHGETFSQNMAWGDCTVCESVAE